MSEELPVSTGENQAIRNDKGQFIPGVSGNPEGKPVGVKNFTTKVREALEKVAEGHNYTYEEALVKSIMKNAIVDGKETSQKLIWNYLDGMPKESIDLDNPKQRDEIEKLREDIKLWIKPKETNV